MAEIINPGWVRKELGDILTGKYKFGTPVDSRAASAHFSKFIQKHLTDEKSRIVDAVITAAEGIGRSAAEVSLAWLKAQPAVGSIIIGGYFFASRERDFAVRI